MPKHGEERNRRLETSPGKSFECQTADGRVIDLGPLAMTTMTVVERWCEHCQVWVESHGVRGRLKFMAEHEDHKETPNAT